MDFELENKIYKIYLEYLIWSLYIPEEYWK